MFKNLNKDLARLDGNSIKKMLNISVWILITYRISNFFYYHNLFIISKLFWLINRLVFTVDIDPGAKLKGGLKLVHPMCIVVGREVESEGALTLYQGTTLGGSNNKVQNYNGKTVKQPYLKDNVIIYSSATVVGPLVIGENSIVAAGATLTKDLPDNSVAYAFNKIKSLK